MFCSSVRGWRIGVSVAAGLCAASVQAQSLPTIDDFFRTPALSEPSLSPSGRYLAVVTGDGNVGARLGVIDLDDRKNSRVVARFDGSDPTHPRWLNDERLIFEGRDTDEASALRRNFGMWAVDRDGRCGGCTAGRPAPGLARYDFDHRADRADNRASQLYGRDGYYRAGRARDRADTLCTRWLALRATKQLRVRLPTGPPSCLP